MTPLGCRWAGRGALSPGGSPGPSLFYWKVTFDLDCPQRPTIELMDFTGVRAIVTGGDSDGTAD